MSGVAARCALRLSRSNSLHRASASRPCRPAIAQIVMAITDSRRLAIRWLHAKAPGAAFGGWRSPGADHRRPPPLAAKRVFRRCEPSEGSVFSSDWRLRHETGSENIDSCCVGCTRARKRSFLRREPIRYCVCRQPDKSADQFLGQDRRWPVEAAESGTWHPALVYPYVRQGE